MRTEAHFSTAHRRIAFTTLSWLLLLILVAAAPARLAAQQDPGGGTEATESGGGATAAASTNSMAVLDDNRKLAFGDVVSYRVVEEGKRPIQLKVLDAGELEVPLIGRVAAKGRTCKEIAHDIKAKLEKEYFHKATVIVAIDFIDVKPGPGGRPGTAYLQDRIFVTGAVGNPGPIALPPPSVAYTLSQAILDAGGFTRFANQKKVVVVRRIDPDDRSRHRKLTVNMDKVMNDGELDKDLELQPNDYVIVKERFFNF